MKRISAAGGVSLIWLGQEVDRHAKDATLTGIDAVTDKCVDTAKTSHPWVNRTGTMEASIQKKPAKETATKISGRWGSYGGRKVRYSFFLEMGTSRMPPFPFLRPAADANYPSLTDEIRKAMP